MTAKFRSKNIADAWFGIAAVILLATGAQAQTAPPAQAAPAPAAAAPTAAVDVPSDYVIGPEDVLSIVYWRDKDMTGDVTVRPDGKISLPLINEVQASGLTPPQLRDKLLDESKRYIEDPN